MKRLLLILPVLPVLPLTLAALPGCARVTVDPLEVKPIYIRADINLRVDRELEDFFGFEKELAPTLPPPPTATPAAPVLVVPVPATQPAPTNAN